MATGNQHTFGPQQDKNFNVRIPSALRERLKTVSQAHEITQADVIRDALENYLPLLEAVTMPKKAG
jgi:predicted DNA-binding protein